MQDLISRQAAIDAIEEYADRLQMVDWKENPGVPYKAYALNWCINTIRELPSAQPARTCVNCGRTVNNGGWYADGGTRCPIEEHYALPKDGFCHLWEKRNVTDDDYTERREE